MKNISKFCQKFFFSLIIFTSYILIIKSESNSDKLEVVAQFNVIKIKTDNGVEECRHCMPAGIKISKNGTIFCSFPRWFDNVLTTVAKYDKENYYFVPWPSTEINEKKIKSVLGFEIDSRDNYIRNIALPSLLGAGIGTAASTVFGLNLFAQKANSVVPVLIQIIGIIVFALFVAFVTVMPFPEYNRPSNSEILFSKEYEKKLINQILQVRLEEEATKHRNTRDGTVCSDKALK